MSDFRNRTHGRPATYNAGCRCPDCRAALARRQRARRQAERVASGAHLPCHWCPFTFTSLRGRAKHETTIHGNGAAA